MCQYEDEITPYLDTTKVGTSLAPYSPNIFFFSSETLSQIVAATFPYK